MKKQTGPSPGILARIQRAFVEDDAEFIKSILQSPELVQGKFTFVNELPLFIMAIKAQANKITGLLLRFRFSLNTVDENHSTALMYAVSSVNLRLVKAILDSDPELDKKNKKGKTALDLAYEKQKQILTDSNSPEELIREIQEVVALILRALESYRRRKEGQQILSSPLPDDLVKKIEEEFKDDKEMSESAYVKFLEDKESEDGLDAPNYTPAPDLYFYRDPMRDKGVIQDKVGGAETASPNKGPASVPKAKVFKGDGPKGNLGKPESAEEEKEKGRWNIETINRFLEAASEHVLSDKRGPNEKEAFTIRDKRGTKDSKGPKDWREKFKKFFIFLGHDKYRPSFNNHLLKSLGKGQKSKMVFNFVPAKGKFKPITYRPLSLLDGYRNANGEDLLMVACRHGELHMVKEFIEKKVDLNTTDKEGNTALFHAIIGGQVEIVELLIKAGSKIDLINVQGETPLWMALEMENVKLMKLLIKNGANIRIRKKGRSLLMLASANGSLEAVSLLLVRGADPFVQDYKGKTALDYALHFGHKKIVKFLKLVQNDLKKRTDQAS